LTKHLSAFSSNYLPDYDKTNHNYNHTTKNNTKNLNNHTGLDWIEQCFTSPPTQYMLYGRRLLQVKQESPADAGIPA